MRLSAGRVRALRLRSQRLIGDHTPGSGKIAQLVRVVAGIQAQDASAAERGVWARGAGLTAAQLKSARVERRSIVRSWMMRGTLHLIDSQTLPLCQAAFGIRFIRTSKSRYRQLGLTEPVMEQAVSTIERRLAEHGPL